MIAGARVEVAPYKRDPMDFVLWKPSKPGEPAWPSPCGIAAPGRPGWHIECSAMADRWLWTETQAALSPDGLAHPHQFDIHGGGIDLVFPHHENEIAQSRCAFHTPVMANYWMHNGFLQVEGKKMAKSEGNFVTIRELLRGWPGSTIRLAMMTTHYREPVDWTRRLIEQADFELAHWTGGNEFAVQAHLIAIERGKGNFNEHLPDEFLGALTEDLNTPKAVTVLRRYAAKFPRTDEEQRHLFLMAEFLGLVRHNRLGIHTRPVYAGALRRHDIDATLRLRAAEANGLVDERDILLRQLTGAGIQVKISSDGWISADATDVEMTRKVQLLVDARNAARRTKDFKEADRIRNELAAMGIVLHDTKDSTTWEIAR
jgi:cysteinyl-tRNA synthetase